MGLTVRSQRVEMDRGLTLSSCAVRAESEGRDSRGAGSCVGEYAVIQAQVTGTQSKSGGFLAYGTEECKSCTASGTAGSRDSNDAINSGLPRLFSLLPSPRPLPLSSLLLCLSLPPFGFTFLFVDFVPHKPTLSSAGSPQPPPYLLSVLKERVCFFPAGFRSSTSRADH